MHSRAIQQAFAIVLINCLVGTALTRGADLLPERIVLQANIESPDAEAGDNFGSSAAMSGDTAIFGSPRDDIGGHQYQGSAYIFVRSGSRWIQQAKLTASDGAAFDTFGSSVAISGDIAVVGAPARETGPGGAYVFVRSGTNWIQQTRLVPNDVQDESEFGRSVSISGLTVVVGAPARDNDTIIQQGAAYVFVRSATTPIWSQQAKLTFLDGAELDRFGVSVSISGSTVIVGIPFDDIGTIRDQGSACIFTRTGTSWSQQARLVADDGMLADLFGTSVTISGNVAIAGAPTTVGQGAAYVFVRSGTVWTRDAKLSDPDGSSAAHFGESASLSGETVIVGAPDEGAFDIGAAYAFTRGSPGNWKQVSKITGTSGTEHLGAGVGISDALWVVGSPNLDSGPSVDKGGAQALSTTFPCDFDGDWKTDIGIFRPSGSEWWIRRSLTATTTATQFGAPSDRFVPADYTGDGKADIAVWRPSTGEWLVLRSENFSFFAFAFGTNGDIPVPFNFDSDSEVEPTVFRPSIGTWFIAQFGQGSGGTEIIQWGANGDIPVPGNFEPTRHGSVAIYRPSNGQWWIDMDFHPTLAVTFGAGADKPVPGDYTGDGLDDIAVWRPSTGEWFVLRSEDGSFFSFPFGANGDIPAPGDYDGDGRYDPTVFRPSSGFWFSQRTSAGLLIQQFGINGDRPLASAFVP